ncbi:hypothetical protein EZ428_23085 [Pedobacter frigiditerrae]|uniref:Uncharacterized protein n=1 Tax=Pedobacter frigiditerrae TaxID=2530452 RepID=A0A4R0MJ19_9SPHI|nr:hypothetical protein [Pedobacter frigiditerrae]TCC86601.1 hypothetical protein EZ428_23085 [Pedobacter frigiditerrae]
MVKKLLYITIAATLSIASCKKNSVTPVTAIKSTNEITAPKGFSWENSRSINLNISISQTKFPGKLYVVAIYTSDPSTGGTLISKGSLNAVTKFKSNLYLSNQVKELYIVCISPDLKVIHKTVVIGITDQDIVFGT